MSGPYQRGPNTHAMEAPSNVTDWTTIRTVRDVPNDEGTTMVSVEEWWEIPTFVADAARAAAPPVERVKRGALAECECVPGHYCDCRDLRQLLTDVLMGGEYGRMEAEGLAADALGLVWNETEDRYVRP